MKIFLIASALLVSLLTFAAPASAQNLGEDRAWQFKSDSRTVTQLNVLNMIQLRENGGYGAMGGSGSPGSGFGGLLGSNAANTNNVFQFIDQSRTTINCSASGGVGSPMTCSGNTNNASGVSQTSSGNTNTAHNDISGNTITSTGNTNNTSNNASVAPTPRGN